MLIETNGYTGIVLVALGGNDVTQEMSGVSIVHIPDVGNDAIPWDDVIDLRRVACEFASKIAKRATKMFDLGTAELRTPVVEVSVEGHLCPNCDEIHTTLVIRASVPITGSRLPMPSDEKKLIELLHDGGAKGLIPDKVRIVPREEMRKHAMEALFSMIARKQAEHGPADKKEIN